MKLIETTSNGPVESGSQNVIKPQRHAKGFIKVRDGRKHPIRGLWQRNDRFYARLAVENDSGAKEVRRIPLEGAKTVAEAVSAMRKLQTQRQESDLPILKRTPKLADYAASYFKYFETVKDAKRATTIQKEKGAMNLWIAHMGETRLNKISRAQIHSFIAKRQGAGIGGRTGNLDVIALRNVLKRAMDDNWIKSLPMQGMKPLKFANRKRQLRTLEEIEMVCNAAVKASKNGEQFSDYVRLMAFCGSRRNETLRLKWEDVNWRSRQLTVGADGLAKNRKSREVDFNEKLEAHLLEMKSRRAPDSQWLFPSPQRGKKDIHVTTFKESLKLSKAYLAEKENTVSNFTFHDCRHFFISFSVMSGIDFMTIAEWVGHQDGGVLIGKVYGHLAQSHRQQQASKLAFVPTIIEQTAIAG